MAAAKLKVSISGMPGVGKTVLHSVLVRALQDALVGTDVQLSFKPGRNIDSPFPSAELAKTRLLAIASRHDNTLEVELEETFARFL